MFTISLINGQVISNIENIYPNGDTTHLDRRSLRIEEVGTIQSAKFVEVTVRKDSHTKSCNIVTIMPNMIVTVMWEDEDDSII